MCKKIISVTAFVFAVSQFIACGEVTTGPPGKKYSLTLVWTAPTTNEDGSDLEDLDGYMVYYGTKSLTYSRTIYVPEHTNYVEVTNLDLGTWYLSITAYDYHGNESVFSNEVIHSFSESIDGSHIEAIF